ncbi:preprotein translocase subunit SecA [Nocardia jinanensis]|uniref:SecA family profile domain-containing protein n=1 Tax=Nocardia jinanensis TaxID=382504 RepID=A0A917VSW8_9NOCA|nr:sigma factor-like helix-turn-helix DNA-binding protein [Nocardia jinanensis]GGL11330.1 hypothetical protein GCM10011588_27280 [Nocardia jinanensis]
MSLQLPPWLPPMVVECTAGHFPRGDETAMRDMAGYWSDKAEDCRTTADHHDDQAVKSEAATRSIGGDGAAQSHRNLAAKFRSQAECNDSLAEQLYENANNTELQKWTVYGFAVLLAWQLLRAAIMFSPAGAAIEMCIQRMATKTALQVVSRKTVIFLAGQSAKYAAERSTLRLAGNAAFWGGLQVGGMNVLVQAGQMINDTRESMDWSSARVMTLSGGAGGAAGAIAGKKIGERWIIPKTVALAEGANSSFGRMLYQVGGTALVGTGAGLAGGIVGTSVGLVGQEFTLESIGETLIPAMVGGFLGAAAQGAADIRSATRAATPAASPGGGRTARALAAGALTVSALAGTLHSDAPPPVDALGGAARHARSVGDISTPSVAEHGSRGHNPSDPAPARRATADLISRPAPFVRAEYNSGIPKPQGPDTVLPDGVNQVRGDHITHPSGEQLPGNKAPLIQSSHAAGESRAPHTDVNTLGPIHPADPAAVGEGLRNHAVSDTAGPRPHHPEGDTAPSESGRSSTNRDTHGTAEHPVTPEARPDRPVAADEPGGAQQPKPADPEPTAESAKAADRAGEPETAEQTAPVDGAGKHPDEADTTTSAGDTVRQHAEETLRDYTARSGPDIPEAQRLVNASDETLVEMLRGSPADATAALIEVIRRGEDKVLRWTQVAAMTAMHESVVNMDAGEGKSLVFVAHAARDAVAHGAVQVITTRDTLANREFIRFTRVLGPLGFDIVRMNPDTAPPPPTPDRPTIYIGTQQDVGFAALRENWVPGRHATIDEIDEALVHADTQYILSDGAGRPADTLVTTQVGVAHDILKKGVLTASDFGLARDRRGSAANLTEGGRQMVERRLGRGLSAGELNRLNMAAAAKWEYVENVHYIRHEIDGRERVFIIDQTTHKVLFDPETSTESRWNGGLAQAIEAEHGLVIQADPKSSKSITAQELFGREHYDKVTGASGTARGSAKQLADLLGTDVISVDRFHDSKLEVMADTISPDEAAKLRTLATDIGQMQETGRPQLILADRNDIVAHLSKLLHSDDPGRPGRVEHIAVDAKWFLEHGTRAEAELQRIFDAAGQEGKVLVINMQGARGVDIPINAVTRELGGLHVAVTGRSALSHDIDIQAQNRAARNGDPGSVRYYTSPSDNLYALTENPMVRQVVVKYVGEYGQAAGEHRVAPSVETQARLSRAENDLRGLVQPLQEEAAAQRRQAAAPAGNTSGPATRAPPADQFDDDERTQHSPATNQLPQSSAGVLSAATAGQQEPLAGKVGKWPAADTDALLRQARDGDPGATQALRRQFGSTTLQHVLTTLGWDPAQGAPAAPVQHLAHAINSAGFRAAQLDGWQTPHGRDLEGWLGEKLQNVMGDALGQLAHTQVGHFAGAQDALRRGHELTAHQLAAVGELTHAVQAQTPAASRAGPEDAAAAVRSTPSVAFPDSPVDPGATPIHNADLAVRTSSRAALFPGGLLETSISNRSTAESSAPTPWFGHTFTADPGATLLIPNTTPRPGRTQQPAQPAQVPAAGAGRAGAVDPAANTPWGRHRTHIGAAHPAAAAVARTSAPGRSVSAPRITESPPPVPNTSPAQAPPSHRATASPAAGLVLALARGTIAGQLPQRVRDALEKDPRALQDGIEQLAPEQRQVLHHRFLLGLSPAETAEALNRSTEAIRTTQYRAFLRLTELLERQVRNESSVVAQKTRGTVAEIPDYVRDCLVQSVRATHALGYDGATIPTKGADTWKALEENLDGAFTRVADSATDPVAHILDRVANSRNRIDTAVIVVDYGTNAHSFTVTTIGDRTVIFDTNIAQPATAKTSAPTDHGRIARVRTRENWEPTDSARIKSAFVLEFTPDAAGRLQPLRPDRVDGPDAAERQRRIQGTPDEAAEPAETPQPGRAAQNNGVARFLDSAPARTARTPEKANANIIRRWRSGTLNSVMNGSVIAGNGLYLSAHGASPAMLSVATMVSSAAQLAGQFAAVPLGHRFRHRETLKTLAASGFVVSAAGAAWMLSGLSGKMAMMIGAVGAYTLIDNIYTNISRLYAKWLANSRREELSAQSLALLERSIASAGGKSFSGLSNKVDWLLTSILGMTNWLNWWVLRSLPTQTRAEFKQARAELKRLAEEEKQQSGKNRKKDPTIIDGLRNLLKDHWMRWYFAATVPAVAAVTIGTTHLNQLITGQEYNMWLGGALLAAVALGITAAKPMESLLRRLSASFTLPLSYFSLALMMLMYGEYPGSFLGIFGAAFFAGMTQMANNLQFGVRWEKSVPSDSIGASTSAIMVINALAGFAGGAALNVVLSHGLRVTGWIEAAALTAAGITASVGGILTRGRNNEQPDSAESAAATNTAIRLARTFRTLSEDNSPEPDYADPKWHGKDNWKPLEATLGAPLRLLRAKGDDAVAGIQETVRTRQNGIAFAVVVTEKDGMVDGAIIANVKGAGIHFGTLLDDPDKIFVAYFTDNNKSTLEWLSPGRADEPKRNLLGRKRTQHPGGKIDNPLTEATPLPEHPGPARQQAHASTDPSPTASLSSPDQLVNSSSAFHTRHPGDNITTSPPQPWKTRRETGRTNTEPAQQPAKAETANTTTTPGQPRNETPDIENALGLPHSNRNPPPWAARPGPTVPDRPLRTQRNPDNSREPEPASRDEPSAESPAPNRPDDFLSATETQHPGAAGTTTRHPQPWKTRQETGTTNTAEQSPDRSAHPPHFKDVFDLPHRRDRYSAPWTPRPGRGVPDAAQTSHHHPEDDDRDLQPASPGEPIPTPTPWQHRQVEGP